MGSVYLKAAILVAAFVGGWTVNGWRLGEGIADAEAQRARDTIEIERLNAEKGNAVAAQHSAEAAAQVVKTRTITKEVIKYVQNPNSGDCSLSGEWVRIHNDATGVPPNAGTPGGANGATGKPKNDIDALVAVTDNYAVCRSNALRLEALQEWVGVVKLTKTTGENDG